jgi:hypothetical protein
MKKYFTLIFILGVISVFAISFAADAYFHTFFTPACNGGQLLGAGTVFQGFQGGTGISTTSASDVGKTLVVASSSPFLTYTLSSAGAGTVTSVDMSVPTGLSISGNPITSAGTLSLTFTGDYSIPKTASTTNGNDAYNSLFATGTSGMILQTNGAVPSWVATSTLNISGGSMIYPGAGIALSTGSGWDTSIVDASGNWNTAYTDRLKWDGGATGLVAATGRTSLGLGTMALEPNTGSTTINTLGTITTGTWSGESILNAKIASSTEYLADIGWNGDLVINASTTNLSVGTKLFLNSGNIIDWDNGDVTLTHSAEKLTFAGGDFQFTNAIYSSTGIFPTSDGGSPLGSNVKNWNGLFLKRGAVINYANGDYTITHATGTLTYSGNVVIPNASTTNLSVSTNSYLGTIKSGTWNGAVVGPTYGGTGLTANAAGTLLYGSALNTWAALASSSPGGYLTIGATGYPSWGATSSLTVLLNLGKIGTITTGTWNATAIGATYGGTGLTSVTPGSLLVSTGVNAWTTLASSTSGNYLGISSTTGRMEWQKINTIESSNNCLFTNGNNGKGNICLDKTNNELQYYGTATSTIVNFGTIVAHYATSTAWSGTTTLLLAPAIQALTFRGVYCETTAGTVGVSLYDGTNRSDYIPTASTTINYIPLTTNVNFTAGESIRVDFGTPASTPVQITCRFKYTYDPT